MITEALIAILILLLYVSSFGIGYILGAGKVTFPIEVDEEDIEKDRKERILAEESRESFNKALKGLTDFGGDFDE